MSARRQGPRAVEEAQEEIRRGGIHLGDRPEFIFTSSTSFPDKLKVRKIINLWPLSFKFRADYTSAARSLDYGCSCKDSVLGGRIRVDIPSQQLEYRKRLALGSGAHVGLTARCDYSGLLMGRASHLNPSFGIQYELGGGAAIWAGNVFDLRQKLRVSRSLGFEVCGSAQLPVPQAQYTFNDQQNTVSLGNGAVHLHLAQVNVTLDL